MFFSKIVKNKTARRIKDKVISIFGVNRSAGVNLKIYPDDVFLTSFPRSGNTWTRFLLAGLLHKEDVGFQDMEQYVPAIYMHSHSSLESFSRPRYLKSHEPYDSRYPKVIYLVRDPRDVAMSYYKWSLKFNRTTKSLDEYINDFLNSNTPYGSWGDHLMSWHSNRKSVPNGFLIIRYEDLLADTEGKLREMAEFLGLDVSVKQLKKTIEDNNIQNMQAKEDKSDDVPLMINKATKIRFIGKGAAGGWKERLTSKQVALFDKSFGEIASKFGYDLSNNQQ